MSPFEIRLRGLLTKWRGFGRTYQIATHFDTDTAAVRRTLLRMERQGIVRRSRHSAVNDISWEFTDGQGQPSGVIPTPAETGGDE